jgi:hypothetical protein
MDLPCEQIIDKRLSGSEENLCCCPLASKNQQLCAADSGHNQNHHDSIGDLVHLGASTAPQRRRGFGFRGDELDGDRDLGSLVLHATQLVLHKP